MIQFIDIPLLADLPEHLSARTNNQSLLNLALISGCIFMTALARSQQRGAFLYLVQGVFFLKPLEELSKEEYKSNSTASFVFVFQFFLVTSSVLFWLFSFKEKAEMFSEFNVLIIVPTIYFVYQFIMTNLAGRISGSSTALTLMNYYTVLLTQLFGLIFLFEFFVSYFQPQVQVYSPVIMGITYISYLLLRFLRGFWIVAEQGVRWYYIILYFWTLEILPLLIAMKLLFRIEFQDWIV